MSKEVFQTAIEDAKKLEKKILEYNPYTGEIVLEKGLDLDPEDFVDLTYNDLVKEYERAQKILKTRAMGIFAKEEAGAKVTVESAEVETKLRQMTTETLERAEAVAKEPSVEEKPPEIELEKPEPEKPAEIELERPVEEKPPEIELEKIEPEKPVGAPEIELEKPEPEKPAEIELERPVEVPEIELEKPEPEKPAEVKIVPPALRETPDAAAEKKYRQIEEQITSILGEKADEFAMKKKMLELTKQLFKEKSYDKRAEIKIQIRVLKDMLTAAKEGKVPKKAKAETTMLKSLISTQQSEIAQSKDTIIGSHKDKVNEIKKKFYEDVAEAEGMATKKEIYDNFVFQVETIVEQLPREVSKHEEFAKTKHKAEIQKLKDSTKDKKSVAACEERLSHIEKNYGKEFSSIKKIIGKEIDSLIEVTGSDIFKKPEEKPKEKDVLSIVKDINETDDGTLLYFLHSKDLNYYRKYERKQISKAEAIAHAKALMAKDRGMSPKDVKKYFSQAED
jgi:hypothetical protein